jgi:hypothetical protein
MGESGEQSCTPGIKVGISILPPLVILRINEVEFQLYLKNAI